MLVVVCELGVGNEGTNSAVRLDVENHGDLKNSQNMDKDVRDCPWLKFEYDVDWCERNNVEPTQFDIEIFGGDALGVDYFVLVDDTGEIQQWDMTIISLP